MYIAMIKNIVIDFYVKRKLYKLSSSFKVLYKMVMVLICFTGCFNVNALELKNIKLKEPHIENKTVMTSIYMNNKGYYARVLYSTSSDEIASALYNLSLGELLLFERINIYEEKSKRKSLSESEIINKYNLTKIKPLDHVLFSEQGSFFDGDKFRIYYQLSSRCPSPFDNYFKVINKELENIEKSFVVLKKGEFIHSSSTECENMIGEKSIGIKAKSLGVNNAWLINDSLYILSMLEDTELLYFDENFEPIELPGNIKLIDKNKLVKFVDKHRFYDKKNLVLNDFRVISEVVVEEFMND